MRWDSSKTSFFIGVDSGDGFSAATAAMLMVTSGLLLLLLVWNTPRTVSDPGAVSHWHMSGRMNLQRPATAGRPALQQAGAAGARAAGNATAAAAGCSSTAAGSKPRGVHPSAAKLPVQPAMVVYGYNCCVQSSIKRACDSARKWGFKECKSHGSHSLASLPALNPEGRSILAGKNTTQRAGFWLWKPLLIWQALQQAADGDIIAYMDADSTIIADPKPLLKLLQHQDVVGFNSSVKDANWAKTDAFLLLNGSQYKNPQELYAGLIIMRRSWQSLGFVSQWLAYAQDPRLVTSMKNTPPPAKPKGQDNLGSLQQRNDQVIFSLLYKRWSFRAFPDPTAKGKDIKGRPYPTIWDMPANKPR